MKVLALMAAKAILAAKAALIIVGSVALKKLFEKDHTSEPAVKVHTINHDDDEHDRIFKYAQYYNNPYKGYYDEYNKNGGMTARWLVTYCIFVVNLLQLFSFFTYNKLYETIQRLKLFVLFVNVTWGCHVTHNHVQQKHP